MKNPVSATQNSPFWGLGGLTNYHSHSVFCDGRAPMEDFVRFAIAKGVRKYGFSAHAPLPFHTSWNMNLEDFPYYKNEFFRLKEKYAGQIELFLGLEVDYIEGVFDAKSSLYSWDDIEYKIGSVHYLDPLPEGGFFSVDGKFYNFQKKLDKIYNGDIRIATERFFEISSNMVRKGGFDIVGHLDKISQNGMNCPGFDKTAKWYVDLVTDYLELIKEQNLMIEINTKSFTELGITYPDVQFFPIVRELRIPVMVNSDCHYPDKITDGFYEVYELLKQAGFQSIMELAGKEWVESPLNSPLGDFLPGAND